MPVLRAESELMTDAPQALEQKYQCTHCEGSGYEPAVGDVPKFGIENLWEDYCCASKPIGELPGGVEEFDVDGMDSAAWAIYQLAKTYQSALGAIRAEVGTSTRAWKIANDALSTDPTKEG